MKLRTVGVICPDCGQPMGYLGPRSTQDTWLGYTRRAWCACNNGVRDLRSWILLYDEQKIFVGIIPGTDRFLQSAGNRIWTADDEEIPF